MRQYLIPQALPVAMLDAQYHQFFDAHVTSLGEHAEAILVEVGEVEMGVGVDQLHGPVRGGGCMSERFVYRHDNIL